MKLIGFNLTKIHAERFPTTLSDLKIETSINIKSIEENSFEGEEKFLNVAFSYIIDYSKKIARIELEGNIIISTDEKSAEEILKSWEKRNLKDPFKVGIFNGIMLKANIKAIQIEDELGLPTHFQMPSLEIPKKE